MNQQPQNCLLSLDCIARLRKGLLSIVFRDYTAKYQMLRSKYYLTAITKLCQTSLIKVHSYFGDNMIADDAALLKASWFQVNQCRDKLTVKTIPQRLICKQYAE